MGERFHSAVIASKCHLIVLPVNAAVTKAANVDAALESLFGEVTLKMGATMDLFRDQMMEGQRDTTMTARTFPAHESLY